jgi:predicted GNAT family acetyltransferase
VGVFSHHCWTVSVRTEEVRVVNNAADERYELWVGDALAGSILYRSRGEALALLHTEVADEFEGQGLGGKLVAGALDDMRERELQLVPICPFVRSYLERHPEQADLVAPRVPGRA